MLQRGSRTVNLLTIARLIFLMLACSSAGIAQSVKPTASPTPQPRSDLHRWFDVETLTLSTRYRYIDSAIGRTTANQQQWQFLGRGRFKFDRKGKYSIVAQLETGNNYTAGWNNTGLGTGDPQTNIFVKHLYFDAKPVKSAEVQFGGISLNNGENTEITGYDNDAYLTGERVLLRAPKQLWFDEISLSNGYVGDLNNPSVFHRFKHLDRSNYHQFLVRKKLNDRVSFSADYTFEAGADTLRQAIRANTKELKIVDSLLYEDYERIDPSAGYGFALSGTKHVTPKFDLTGGFVKISHVMFNADRFPGGERLYLSATYKLTRELFVNPVMIQAVGPLPTPAAPRTRFDLIIGYNILEALLHWRIY